MHFYPRNRSKVIVYQVNHATKGNNVQLLMTGSVIVVTVFFRCRENPAALLSEV